MSKVERILSNQSSESDTGKEFQAMNQKIFDFQKEMGNFIQMARKIKDDKLRKDLINIDTSLDKIRRDIYDLRSGT